MIEPFEDVERYEVLAGAVANTDAGAISRAAVSGRAGEYALRLAFTRQRAGLPLAGFRPRSASTDLPVLASESFLDATK